jgi:glycerol kinase
MAQALLAIDQGTTSSRAIVFDRLGTVLGLAQSPVAVTFPNSGWVNQDAAELWTRTLDVTRQAIKRAGISPSEIAGIGIANQRETTILWERSTGMPVAPAIVWQSRQSAPQVRALIERGKGETYQHITGLVPDAYFSATKLAWLFEEQPELRRRAEAGDLLFGTVDCWLMWNLSGGRFHVTDCSNASRTMLVDIKHVCWSDELLRDLGIPTAILPQIVANSTVLFETEPSLLGAPVAVAGTAGDQQAALFGQACFRVGEAKNTYGTGSFLLMNTGSNAVESPSNLLTTIAWQLGQKVTYALEGAVFVTGSAVQWLRDGLGIVKASVDVEELAASVPDSGGVVFVPALVGLGAPHWDQDARGTIAGITRGTTAAHIARATLEAIALQTRDVLDAMTSDSGISLTELRVDGGAAQNDLLMQIQADVLSVPVVRPTMTETTALGAAYLAGLSTGVLSGPDEIQAMWMVDRRFEPRMAESDRDRMYRRWLEAVERSKGWASNASA